MKDDCILQQLQKKLFLCRFSRINILFAVKLLYLVSLKVLLMALSKIDPALLIDICIYLVWYFPAKSIIKISSILHNQNKTREKNYWRRTLVFQNFEERIMMYFEKIEIAQKTDIQIFYSFRTKKKLKKIPKKNMHLRMKGTKLIWRFIFQKNIFYWKKLKNLH